MKPIIGIVPSLTKSNDNYIIHQANVLAIENAGGIALLLPYVKEEDDLRAITERIDGLYLTGGNDIDPIYFKEEPHRKLGRVDPTRDEFEIKLTQIMFTKNKPILGVCRGSQIINIAAGGTMYQDIYAQMDGNPHQHIQTAPIEYPFHTVNVTQNTLLHRIVTDKKIRVNSMHHQANWRLGEFLRVSAFAKDGVIEAIESKEHEYVVGVQWHPEQLALNDDIPSKQLFASFIAACKNKNKRSNW